MNRLSFPSPPYARAADAATRFLATVPVVDAVLLIGSCARRGDANDLDLCALVSDSEGIADLNERWTTFAAEAPELSELPKLGPFIELDLDVTDGRFAPQHHGWMTGPDAFELDVGNFVAHSIPLWERTDRYRALRERWLPYYDNELRGTRLAEVRMYFTNNLEHVPVMIRRHEPFSAFHRLYLAFQEFLQCLFISRRTYPIAYDKWIREQVEELLGLPELYGELPAIIGIRNLDLRAIEKSTQTLDRLFATWVEV